MLKAFSASYKKESREVNEDSLGIIDGRFYMVADGVSSSPRGDLASVEAVRLFLEYFGERITEPEDWELRRFLINARNQVSRASNGSRTTVAAAWVWPLDEDIFSIFGVSIGDSRLYILDTRGEPVLRQVSRDHTVREFSLRTMRMVTKLSATCGGQSLPDVELAITRQYLAPGEWLIIVTDGAWGYIEKNREWFLGSIPRFRERPDYMVDYLAKTAASQQRDDATIIMLQNED